MTTVSPAGGEVTPRHSHLRAIVLAATFACIVGASAQTASAQTLPEGVPDFSLDATRPSAQTAQSGSWSNPSTWQGGVIPTANHIVRIATAHTVTIDDPSAVGYTVAVFGKLAFNTTVNTRLTVTNLEVMAGTNGMGTPGVLEVGTAAAPVAANVTAEIVIANSPLGASVADPDQFGTGMQVFGKVTMHGAIKTPTFVKLATEPRAGNTTLTLSAAVAGWTIGDRLVLPDTRHIKESEVTGSGWINAVNQWEERTVQALSADGKTITLNAALQYDHLGARDLNGVLDFLPHVGNLTRNVVIRSESATGTRGHTIFVHMAETDVRYVLFKDLGRTKYLPLDTTTNHIGRYAYHAHHLMGPSTTPANGYQFTVVGNAVDGGSVETQFKWGVTVHGSHYGLIQDNVVYNYNGASFATEDGSESFNVFDHNFALRGMGEPNDSVSEARMALGTEGVGFWFRGVNNYVRNNVAANFQNSTTEAAYGFAYQLRFLGTVAIPNFKGADTTAPGQFTNQDGNNMPILQFENNEAYGAMQGGFTLWWISSQDPQPGANSQESLIKDLKLWNIYNKTVYMYPAQKIVFDGLKIRASFNSLSRCCGNGIYFADYSSKGIVVRNSDIQGVEEGITTPEAGFGPEPNLTIENSYLRNNVNVAVPTNGSVNGCWMQDKLIVISNTRFDAPPGRSLSAVSMVRDVASAPECLAKLDQVRVYAYQGVATDNFQVYHQDTVVMPRPPAGCTTVTKAGVSGPTCAIAPLGPVPPTATLTASPTSIQVGQSSTLTWTTTNATTISIDQGIGAVAGSGTRVVSPAANTTYTLTATNSTGSVTATATVTATSDTTAPVISAVASSSITSSGATITFTTNEQSFHQIEYGTTTSYGTMTTLDTMLMTSHSETLAGLAAGTLYHYRARATDAAGNTGLSGDLTFTTAPAGTPTANNKDRANSYDDAWQTGPTGWVANAQAILAGGSGQVPGLVLWIGDSLTRDPALGAWAQGGAGKTAEDQMITNWMHAGLSPQSIDSIDGFTLATPYICSARSYTVGDGLGSWDFMGTSSMPADTNPTTARQKLQDCTTYPNALNLTTILASIQKAQFAIPEVNLDAARPGVFPDFQNMVDLLISQHIVPIIITYTYRNDAAFNLLVDQYNTALRQYAQTKKLPLIDLQAEMLARLPFTQWSGRFLSSDGVHYTHGTTTFPSTSDPYASGGDPTTHTTGQALTLDGYGLKGWLGVQKMKEIKQLVVDALPSPPPTPTATLSASPTSIIAGASSTLTWSTTNATTVSIDQGIGTVAASGTRSASPTANVTYTLTATNSSGSTTATASVTVTPCSYTLGATTASPPASATAGTVGITTQSVCGWTATSNATTWLTVSSGASGTGSGSVGYSVAANPTTTSRTGTLTIAGQPFTVTQAGLACSFTLSPTGASPSAAAGSAAVGVTASVNTCSWSAVSNAPWITVDSGSTGAGNGSVGYSYTANSGTTSRTGTMTIAGATFSVVQSGAVTCTYSIAPAAQSAGVSGGIVSVGVTTTSACSWTASSPVPWVTVSSPTAPASGNGTASLQVQTNTGSAARTATVTIAGRSESITQPGTSNIGSSITDFNGDGVADTLSYNAATGAWTMNVTGTGAVASGTWPAGLNVQTVDLDGNGLSDMFGYNSTSGAWVKAVNTGQNSFTSVAGTWWPGWQVSLLDLDGRGQYTVFLDNGVGSMTPLTTGIAGESQMRPWLSSDRLRMYFSSTRASSGSRADLFASTRASVSAAFSTPTAIAELNLPTSNTSAPSLTSDELTMVFDSDRAGGIGGTDVWIATRSSLAGTFAAPQPLSGINSSSRDGDPELSLDGMKLYFESDRAGGVGNLDLWFATRDAPGSPFGGAANFRTLNTSGVENHPALSSDTQTLYFSSDRAGGAATGNIWQARVRCDAASAGQSSFTASGGTTTVTVADASGCAWAAQTTSNWISFTGPGSGNGPGSVTMTIAANSGAARSGIVTIGGQTLSVSQAAVVSTPPPAPPVPGPPPPAPPAPPSPPAPAPGPSPDPSPAPDPSPTSGDTPSPTSAPSDPGAPINLRSFVNGSTVVLAWDGPGSGAPSGYLIEAGSRPGAADLAQLVVGDRTFTANGVGSGVYMVRVRTLYPDHSSGASNEVAVVVGGGCSAAPAAPTGLAYSVSGSTVTLTWNAAPGGVTSYALVAGYSSGAGNAANADTGNSYTTFVATGVPRGVYYVRLHARNACGVSGPSNEVAVNVP